MRLFLTGFMGAGKSTVGDLLANQLGIPFRDLDLMIEAAAGKSVREIFAEGGEVEFRRRERVALAEAISLDPVVVALGGGTLGVAGALDLMRHSGAVVWLHPSFDTIVRRIGALGKEDRPLFRDEAAAFELYRARLPVYQRADLTVEVGADEQAAEVAARLALRLAEAPCST